MKILPLVQKSVLSFEDTENKNCDKLLIKHPMLLCLSAYEGNLLLTKLLLKSGLDINTTSLSKGLTALHSAVLGQRLDMINFLLENKASVDIKTFSGAVPLHYAVHARDWDIITILCINGCNLNIKDDDGKSPLDYVDDEHHFSVLNKIQSVDNYLKEYNYNSLEKINISDDVISSASDNETKKIAIQRLEHNILNRAEKSLYYVQRKINNLFSHTSSFKSFNLLRNLLNSDDSPVLSLKAIVGSFLILNISYIKNTKYLLPEELADYLETFPIKFEIDNSITNDSNGSNDDAINVTGVGACHY